MLANGLLLIAALAAGAEVAPGSLAFSRRPLLPLAVAAGPQGTLNYEARVAQIEAGMATVVQVAGWPGATVGKVPVSELVSLDDAVAYFTEKLKAKPGDRWALVCRGRAWQLKNDAELALADFTELMRNEPGAWAYVMRGRARMAAGQQALANADFAEALRLDPTYAPAYAFRGQTLLAAKAYEAALKDFGRALALSPKYSEVRVWRGNAYAAMGRHADALKEHDAALADNPNDVLGNFNRGSALSALDRHADALAAYDAALALYPTFLPALYNRATAKLELGKPEDALADLDAVVAAEPAFIGARVSRGVARRRTGAWEGAKADLEQVLKVEPEHYSATMQLAWLLATCPDKKFADPAKALVLAKKVADERDGAWHSLMAACHTASGNFKAAVAAQELALARSDSALAPKLKSELDALKTGKAPKAN